MLVDHNKPDLVPDPYAETDLGEVCVPVSRQLRLVNVKPGLSAWKVEINLVAPEFRIVGKGFLGINTEITITFAVNNPHLTNYPLTRPSG